MHETCSTYINIHRVPAQFVRVPSDFTVHNSLVDYDTLNSFLRISMQHRFKDVNAVNKCVRAYVLPGSNQCIVNLLVSASSKYCVVLPSCTG